MYKKKLHWIWLGFAVGIYIAIFVLSIVIQNSAATDIVKLAGILFCVLYTVFNTPMDILLVLAMLLTFVADLILAQDNTALLGVMVFLVVQLLHFRRLSKISGVGMAAVGGAIALMLVLNLWFALMPALFLTCGIYAGMSITNIVLAAKWRRAEPKNPHALAAALGFPLFAACDSCTVVSYLALQGVIASGIYAPINIIVWLFYYPAQIFIANSSKCGTIGVKEGKKLTEV